MLPIGTKRNCPPPHPPTINILSLTCFCISKVIYNIFKIKFYSYVTLSLSLRLKLLDKLVFSAFERISKFCFLHLLKTTVKLHSLFLVYSNKFIQMLMFEYNSRRCLDPIKLLGCDCDISSYLSSLLSTKGSF